MANEYIRKNWRGVATRTTLSAAINNAIASFSVADAGTYPITNFVIVVDRGLATEEKMLVASKTSNTFTITARGYDGTSAQAHAAGAYVEHCLDAYTIEQANIMATTMTGVGDLLYKSAAGADNTSFARLPLGTSGLPLLAGASAPAWGQVGAAGIAPNAIDTSKILDGTIVDGDISSSAAILVSKLYGAAIQYGSLITDGSSVPKWQSSGYIIDLLANRPFGSSGMLFYALDTKDMYLHDGTAWTLWHRPQTVYTPTLTNVTGGTPTATYTIGPGKKLDLHMNMVAGTVTAAGSFSVSLPSGIATAASPTIQLSVGQIGGTPALASARSAGGATTIVCFADAAGNNWAAGAALSTYRLSASLQIA